MLANTKSERMNGTYVKNFRLRATSEVQLYTFRELQKMLWPKQSVVVSKLIALLLLFVVYMASKVNHYICSLIDIYFNQMEEFYITF